MKQVFVCDEKNCQSTKSAKSMCDDKNCQSTQCIHMWLVKSAMKPSHVCSVRPAMLQSSYKKHSYKECDNKNCQSTKSMYNDKNCTSAKSIYDDKNWQSVKCVHMQKPAMPQSIYRNVTQSTHLWSVSKTARKQIGTQPEVTRNCQDSTSKCWYPSVSRNVCQDSRSSKMQLHSWGQWTQERCNQIICSQWKLSSRSHKSTQGDKYRQANIKGTLKPKLDL